MKLDLSKQYDRDKFDAYANKLKDQGACVDLVKKRRSRTLSQNAYLHVIIGLVAKYVGDSDERMKKYLKVGLLPSMFPIQKINLFGKVIAEIRSTTDLDKEEMSICINKAIEWAESLGVHIPDLKYSEENIFSLEQELEKGQYYQRLTS